RSTRSAPAGARRASRRARATETTVVPEPPWADQQARSMGPPTAGAARCAAGGLRGKRRRGPAVDGRSRAGGRQGPIARPQRRGPARYPPGVAPPEDGLRPAAFFDLDKTVIAKASMVAFSKPLHRAGMLSRRMMLRAAWGQILYAQFGASPEKLEKLRESVLQLTKGWDQSEISAIVRESLAETIEPIVFEEALERIRQHRAWGHKVFIVSASPEEVVAPIAQLLGVDE